MLIFISIHLGILHLAAERRPDEAEKVRSGFCVIMMFPSLGRVGLEILHHAPHIGRQRTHRLLFAIIVEPGRHSEGAHTPVYCILG